MGWFRSSVQGLLQFNFGILRENLDSMIQVALCQAAQLRRLAWPIRFPASARARARMVHPQNGQSLENDSEEASIAPW